MQFAYQLDPVTKEKIVKSFILGSSAFVLGAIPVLQANPQVIEFLKQHLLLGVAVTAYIPVVINAINQWRKGIEDPTDPRV